MWREINVTRCKHYSYRERFLWFFCDELAVYRWYRCWTRSDSRVALRSNLIFIIDGVFGGCFRHFFFLLFAHDSTSGSRSRSFAISRRHRRRRRRRHRRRRRCHRPIWPSLSLTWCGKEERNWGNFSSLQSILKRFLILSACHKATWRWWREGLFFSHFFFSHSFSFSRNLLLFVSF